MLSLNIEKEIKKENKVLGEFNLRQVICISVATIIAVPLYFILGLPIDIYAIPLMVIGAMVWYAGWPHKNHLMAEQILSKKMIKAYYKNDVRKYNTMNGYVGLLNSSYRKKRAQDLSNKTILKSYKQQQKKLQKKKSSIKAIL